MSTKSRIERSWSADGWRKNDETKRAVRASQLGRPLTEQQEKLVINKAPKSFQFIEAGGRGLRQQVVSDSAESED